MVADTKIIAVGLQGHGHGMVIPIPCLGQHLIGEGISRQMTIDAGRSIPMRTVLPGFKGGYHGVTGDANLRLARQVGEHLGLMHQIGKYAKKRENSKYRYIFHDANGLPKQPFGSLCLPWPNTGSTCPPPTLVLHAPLAHLGINHKIKVNQGEHSLPATSERMQTL